MASAIIGRAEGVDAIAGNAVRNAVRRHGVACDQRFHWMALGATGLRSDDAIHLIGDLPVVMEIAESLGLSRAATQATATVVVWHRPTENELISLVNRMRPGVRLVVYNDEADIERMFERSFDLATACIFDRESRRVVRIYDRPKRVEAYIDVELGDLTDSSIPIHATRIAVLR